MEKEVRSMTKKKQPKYNVDDIVVITLYGTVGKITNINFLFLLGIHHLRKMHNAKVITC
jgi:CTP synthase (UTP-ammonia lyase)